MIRKKAPVALAVGYGYVFADPNSRNISSALKDAGWKVHALQGDLGASIPHTVIPGVTHTDSARPNFPGFFSRLNGPIAFWIYRRNLKRLITLLKPDLVVTFTLHDVAALPQSIQRKKYRLACGILDIPVPEDAGKSDRQINATGWQKLRYADVVWASDPYKASLAKQFGDLDQEPMVSYNVSKLDYLSEPFYPRDPWLRQQLRFQGAMLNDTGGCILLRAGAIGASCGIEETLAAFQDLPDDFVFLMMGRPDGAYRRHLEALITERNLERKAFFWDRPDDVVWKRALRGAGRWTLDPWTIHSRQLAEIIRI